MGMGTEIVDVSDLKKRVDHLQYDEINPIKEEISNIKISLSSNDILTKQAVESNQRLSETIDTLKTTMIEVAQSVKDSNRINGEITKTIEELNKKITSVEKNTEQSLNDFSNKIDSLDNKSKIDILDWIKNNWLGVVLTIGAFGYIIAQTIK